MKRNRHLDGDNIYIRTTLSKDIKIEKNLWDFA